MLQRPHFHLGSHVTQVACCCFSPDGDTILSGSGDETLKLWRTRDGLCYGTLSGIPYCNDPNSREVSATVLTQGLTDLPDPPQSCSNNTCS